MAGRVRNVINIRNFIKLLGKEVVTEPCSRNYNRLVIRLGV